MKQFLPLGSIVTLKESEAKMMIIGRSQVCEGVQYDYSAVLFPVGYTGSDQLFVFNNEDVDIMFYLGMQDIEEFAFRQAFAEAEEEQANGAVSGDEASTAEDDTEGESES